MLDVSCGNVAVIVSLPSGLEFDDDFSSYRKVRLGTVNFFKKIRPCVVIFADFFISVKMHFLVANTNKQVVGKTSLIGQIAASSSTLQLGIAIFFIFGFF